MARLEAVEKLLYYPTPIEVAEAIGKRLDFGVSWGGEAAHTILDPCAGDGEAVLAFSKSIGTKYSSADKRKVKLFAVELDEERAKACIDSNKFRRVLTGPFERTIISPNKFSVVFCNPPYDTGDGERQEITWLRRSVDLLADHGIMIWIVPIHVAMSEAAAPQLRRLHDVNIQKFPDHLFDRFKQVIVIGTKSRYTQSYGQDLRVYPFGSSPCNVPIYQSDIDLREDLFTIDNTAPRAPRFDLGEGAFGTARFVNITSAESAVFCNPLVAPRAGHQAMLLASGALNGHRVGNTIVKGRAFKSITSKSDGETTTESESLNTEISTLDLSTFEVDTWNVADNPDKTKQWFLENQEELMGSIVNKFVPNFDGDTTPWSVPLSEVKAPHALPGHSVAELLDVQKHTACAIAFHFRNNKGVLLSGEMGVGKTLISIAASHICGHKKNVVVCPTHLTKKWEKEVNSALGKGSACIARTLVDIDRFFADPSKRFLVVSKERAKLGSKWRFAANSKMLEIDGRTLQVHGCPKCGTEDGLDYDLHERIVSGKLKGKCMKCGEQLWQTTPLSARGTKRWPAASHIGNRYEHKYHLIVDECHQFSHGDTDQSKAVSRLVSGSLTTIAMTGTLYSGRASTLFHTLFRLDSSFRQTYGYSEASKFSAMYGFFESKHKESETTSRYGRSRGKTGERVKEIPGLSPSMIPLILPYTIFVKLKDLHHDLPPYTELVETVEHDVEVMYAYKRFLSEIGPELRKNPKVMGQYLQAGLGWLDKVEQDERISFINENGDEELVATLPAIESPKYLPKDIRAADICEESIRNGGKCIIFMTQTSRRNARSRVAALLRERGINAKIMGSNVAPEKRIEWVEKNLESGMEVMITNGRLVETGMDLLFASTIIQFGIEYSVHSLRQSVRRSWRLGQCNPVFVHYMAYRDTLQEIALTLIAQKMKAAEAIDGDDIGGLGSSAKTNSDFFIELARLAFRDS